MELCGAARYLAVNGRARKDRRLGGGGRTSAAATAYLACNGMGDNTLSGRCMAAGGPGVGAVTPRIWREDGGGCGRFPSAHWPPLPAHTAHLHFAPKENDAVAWDEAWFQAKNGNMRTFCALSPCGVCPKTMKTRHALALSAGKAARAARAPMNNSIHITHVNNGWHVMKYGTLCKTRQRGAQRSGARPAGVCAQALSRRLALALASSRLMCRACISSSLVHGASILPGMGGGSSPANSPRQQRAWWRRRHPNGMKRETGSLRWLFLWKDEL